MSTSKFRYNILFTDPIFIFNIFWGGGWLTKMLHTPLRALFQVNDCWCVYLCNLQVYSRVRSTLDSKPHVRRTTTGTFKGGSGIRGNLKLRVPDAWPEHGENTPRDKNQENRRPIRLVTTTIVTRYTV